MRSLSNEIGVAVLIPAAVYSADTTPTLVDRAGFDSAMIAIEVGAGGITFTTSNKIEFVLTHGDAADGSDQAAVTDSDMMVVSGITGGIIKSLTTAHAAGDVSVAGYIGEKRYVGLKADFSGTHGTGTPISALLIQGDARIEPVN